MSRIFSCLSIYLFVCGENVDTITQDFYWRDYIYGDIPYDAIEVAPGKYIGQVNHEGHTNPAMIFSYDGIASTEYNGRVDIYNTIRILCAPDPSRLYWEYVDFNKNNDKQMRDVVKGGYQPALKIPLFIGKALRDGEWKIGKVASITTPWKGLWIWDKDNKTLRLYEFYILKYNLTTVTRDISMTFDTSIPEFCWRDYTPGHIPQDALEGAPGLYIGQVNHHGNCPACIYPQSNIAITELYGKMTFANNIKILCTSQPSKFYWQRVNFTEYSGKEMKDAVKGGFLSPSLIDLYIGRINHSGLWLIGRVMPIDNLYRGLWLWNEQDKPWRVYEFEILKYNSSSTNCDSPGHGHGHKGKD